MPMIELTKEAKAEAIEDIKNFFRNERDEDISEFHAVIILDFMLSRIGPFVYNQAIGDAYRLMSGKLEDIFGLEKRRFR